MSYIAGVRTWAAGNDCEHEEIFTYDVLLRARFHSTLAGPRTRVLRTVGSGTSHFLLVPSHSL